LPSVDKERRNADGSYWTRIHWYAGGIRQQPVTVRAATKKELDAEVAAEEARLEHEIHLLKKRDAGDLGAVAEVMNCTDLVRDWIRLYVAVELTGSTPREYIKDAAEWFVPFWGETTLSKLTPVQGLEWRAWLQERICSPDNSNLSTYEKAGEARVNRLLTMGRSIFSFAVRNRWIASDDHPLRNVAQLDYYAPADRDDFDFEPELAEAIRLVIAEIKPQHRANEVLQKEAKLGISCLAYLGLAQQDLFDARFEQALHDDGTPRDYFEIPRRPTGSGRKSRNRKREVAMPRQVQDEVVALWKARGCPALSELIVPNGKGKSYTRQNWQRDFWRPAIAAVKELRVETVRAGEKVVELSDRREKKVPEHKPRFQDIPAGEGIGPHAARRCAVGVWAIAGWLDADVLDSIGHDATNDRTLYRFYKKAKKAHKRKNFVPVEEQIDEARAKYSSAAAIVERDRVLAEPRERAKQLAARQKTGRAAYRLEESRRSDESAAEPEQLTASPQLLRGDDRPAA
jgi:hypothetical protein